MATPSATKRAQRSTRASPLIDQSRSIGATTLTNRSVRSGEARRASSALCARACAAAQTPPAIARQTMAIRAFLMATSSTATAAKAIASAYECPRARPATYAISGSAAGTSPVRFRSGLVVGTLERSERFHVMGVGEKVEEVERSESPTRRDQPARVTRKRYRIAGQEAN